MDNYLDLGAIRRRLDNATPGPWHVEYGKGGKRQNTVVVAPNHKLARSTNEVHGSAHHIATIWNVSCTCVQGHQYDNQEFIAHARTDIELLIDEIKRLTNLLAK